MSERLTDMVIIVERHSSGLWDFDNLKEEAKNGIDEHE